MYTAYFFICKTLNSLSTEPYKPTGLQVHATITAVHTYQLNVSWDQPPINPMQYTIILADSSGTNHSFIVNGTETQLVLGQPLRLFDNPMLRVIAKSDGGQTQTTMPINLKEAYMQVAGY